MSFAAWRRIVAAVAVLVAVGVAASPSSVAAPRSAPAAQLVTRLLIIAVPGLQWSDVAQLPSLQRFVAHAAIGNLSVRTEPTTTRCAGGELAFTSGARTGAAGVECFPNAAAFETAARAEMQRDPRVRPGALGEALRRAGWTTLAADDATSPLLDGLDPGGTALAGGVGCRARATSLFLPRLHQIAYGCLDDELNSSGSHSDAALRALDARLRGELAIATATTFTVVAGISDTATGPSQAHVLAISGPGWGHSGIRSGTTHRTGWAQLIDIAPTLLTGAGIPVPAAMTGKPIRPDGPAPSIASLGDDARHARAAAVAKFWTISGICTLAGIALLLLLARRRRAGAIALASATAAPVLTFLGQLLPWWRWPLLLDAALLLAISVAAGVAITRLARRNLLAAIVAVPAMTAVVLGIDQLAGAPLQLSAPLGDNPLAAGRFHGMGNIAFALFGASTLLLAALAAAHARRGRVAAIGVAAVTAVAAMVFDGAPGLGDDFGGLLALAIASGVLVLLVSGARPTWRRVAAIVGMAIVVVVGVALLDYARPHDAQTHLGRFVGSVLHGGAGDTVSRKADAALHSFGNVPVTGLVVLVVVLGLFARRRVAGYARATPGLATTGVVVVVLAVVGSAVNDSGIVVAAMAAVAGLLPPVAAAVASGREEYWPGDGRGR